MTAFARQAARLAVLAALAAAVSVPGPAHASTVVGRGPVAGSGCLLGGVLPLCLPRIESVGESRPAEEPTPLPPPTGAPPTAEPTPTPADPTGPPATSPAADPSPSPTPLDTTPAPTPAPSPTPTASPPAPPPGPTVVTLGFDDNTTDQLRAGDVLRSLGLHGVFYVNSGRLDAGGDFMSASQVRGLQAGGHEIGGHTVFHLHLSEQDPPEQLRQICTDRARLLALGLNVTDLAYPFGDLDASSRLAAQHCGYNSARTSGGVGCSGCEPAEALPPADRYAMRSIAGLTSTLTADQLITVVKRAQAKGGWVQIVFHRICAADACASNGVRLAQFTAFAQWLALQHGTKALRVATVREVLGGAVQPAVAGPPPTATRLAVANPSFEEPGPAALPRCYAISTNGDGNGYTAARVAGGHTGAWAEQVNVSTVAGGVKLISTQDLGSCAPPIVAGHGYRISVWYRAPAPITLLAYARRPLGSYSPLGTSPELPAAPTWTLAVWTSRGAPYTPNLALSVGVFMSVPGTYVLDDFAVADAGVVPVSTDTSVEGQSADRGDPAKDLFLPPGAAPDVSVGPAASVAEESGSFGWRLAFGIAGALVLMFVVVVALDRRLGQIHRATLRRPTPTPTSSTSRRS